MKLCKLGRAGVAFLLRGKSTLEEWDTAALYVSEERVEGGASLKYVASHET